ncbi:MAG: threonylcarbamoyl-AMP synthase [Lachnospiraceae bacterium]|nr:threonylcarbamoyl-AMP synthase [Lachnospiraceae bacterium]
MQTEHIRLDAENIDEELIAHAAQVLADGGLVAFPTETVYGLGANALDADAARRIYEAKGRPSDNPLIVHIAGADRLGDVAKDVPGTAKKLAERFWPGPLTMVLHKQPDIPDATTGGLATVAVRCPSNRIASELIKKSGCPVAAPSANRSGRPSTTRYAHVTEDLDGRVDMIIDGGDAPIGLESTIVDLTADVPTILRPGYVTKEDLEAVVGKVQVDPALTRDAAETAGRASGQAHNTAGKASGDAAPSGMDAGLHPKAPGMKYRHYAPKGDLYLVQGSEGDVIRCINKLVEAAQQEGKTVGIIATAETKERYRSGTVLDVGTRPEEVAASLYDVLRQFDTLGAEVIYAEFLSGSGLGAAIENRLLKAASYQVLDAPKPMQSSRRRKLIFVEGHGNARSAMAAALFDRLYESSDMEAVSRGIVVQFPEPLNQKTEAVMVSNGITLEGFVSEQLSDEEIDQDTMLFTMEERQRQQVLSKFPSATEENTFLLSEYVGDELEIMDPYGGTLQTYGICFEVIRASIQKLSDRILEEKTL